MGKRLKNPYNFFASLPDRYDRTAYSDGPTGQTGLAFGLFRYGLPLASGEYFTQRWGFWGDENNNFYMVPMPEGTNVRTQTTGWYVKNQFPQIDFNTSSSRRFASFSFCFDSSGVPLFTIEDEGDGSVGYYSEPLIRVAYSGGGMMKSWNGRSPVLFNMAQINYPFKIPSDLAPTYKTGEVVCFYLKDTGTNIYMRTLATNFDTPYLVNTGLTPGTWNTIRIDRNIINSRSGEYLPHKSVMYIPSPNRNVVKIVTSKSHINYAIDDFQNLPTGFHYGLFLTEGYGRWLKYSEYSDTSGQALDLNFLYQDDFEEYDTGSNTFFRRGLNKTFINASGHTGTNQNFGSVTNRENSIIEDFEVYSEGFINVLRRNIANVEMTGFTTGITIINTANYNFYAMNDFELLSTGVIYGFISYNTSLRVIEYVSGIGFPQIVIIDSGSLGS